MDALKLTQPTVMFSYYRRSFLRHLQSLRSLASNPSDFGLLYELQRQLLSSTIRIEKRLRACRGQARTVRSRIRNPHLPRLTKAEAARLKAREEDLKRRCDEYGRLMGLLKAIGDGVAFLYLSKWDLKTMVFKEKPGFISGKEGLSLERRVLREAFARGGFAILNDLTTCLRYGDLTVPGAEGFMIIELKSGGTGARSDRAKRQVEKIEKVIGYFSSDKADNLYGIKGTTERRALLSPEVNYQNQINDLIAEAYESGIAAQELEPGFHIVVSRRGETVPELERAISTYRGAPIVHFVNEQKYHALGYYPFTLIMRTPEWVYDFYAGNFVILGLLDSAVIQHVADQHGFLLELDISSELPVCCYRGPLDAPEVVFSITWHMFGRIFAEFTSPRWLLSQQMAQVELAMSESPEVEDVDYPKRSLAEIREEALRSLRDRS